MELRNLVRDQKKSVLNRIVKPLSLDRQFNDTIQRFRDHKTKVEDEVRACHIIEAAEYRELERRNRELQEITQRGIFPLKGFLLCASKQPL